MKRVLFVHHSADMYGADKVLLALVQGLDKAEFIPLVVLPREGPLVDAMNRAGVETHIVPLAKIERATLSARGLFRLPLQIVRSLRAIDMVLSGRQVDIVHSNTLAVLSGAFWAWKNRKLHVWHVHEIIVHPVWVRKIYAHLLDWLADRIICVSHATENNLLLDRPGLAKKTAVVWNGIERFVTRNEVAAVSTYRREIGLKEGELLIALVGRINRLKGQRLLVEAADLLWKQGIHNLKFLIVGSVVPGQEHFGEALRRDIAASPAVNCFVLQSFTAQVEAVWDACDMAVIPSTEPESFGMVALEAMRAGKPVVAADHGGLSEIVVDEETGLLVEPGNVEELAAAISRLARDEHERKSFGERGYDRVQRFFSLRGQIISISKVYDSLQSPLPP